MEFQDKGVQIAPDYEILLEEVVVKVGSLLSEIAQSDHFMSILETAFGTQSDALPAGNLQQALLHRTFLEEVDIELLPSDTLQGALGAYAGTENTIYLSQELLAFSSQQATAVLLEEIGHAIDAQMNVVDSPGDEGAIFSALAQGEILNAEEIAQLASENDRATVVINGERVTIEQANFIVTNNEDSGAGSLRQAITEANNTNGADTITFDANLSGQTITLTGDQLEITDSVTIEGLGAEELTIDATGNSRAIEVSDEQTDNPLQVSIEGVTITGGSAVGPNDNTNTTDRFGGAIFNRESLTLKNVVIQGNSAERDGGGIYNDRFGGSLEVIDSLISENQTSDQFGNGGGIGNGGILILNNTTISNNSASSAGGGITNFSNGDIVLNNSRIEDNTAYSGGGIDNDGVFTVTSSTIANNVATNNGGGIHNAGDDEVGMTISRSTISGNSALVGGGIDTANELLISNSTVSSNSAETQGGGINNTNTLTTLSSTIAQNTSPSAGGLFNADAELTLINSLIAGNDSQDLLNEIQEGFITRTGVINNNGVNLVADGSFTEENILNVDPLLSPLQDNGGSTLTHLLLEGSPAIDVGETILIGEPFDQRGEGFDRVVNGTVDLGAVEVDNTGLEPNTPPNAEDDEVSAIVGNSIIVNVLENDNDEDNDPLTVTIVTPPENGSAEVVGENNTQIAYSSNQDFSGTDTLVYEVSDGRTGTDTATVTIQVEPIALDDVATTTTNTEVAINVFANDRPINGEGLTLTFDETSVNGGEVTQDPQTNELIYTPPTDFTGTDTFNYTINDGNFNSEAVVSVTVEEEVPPRNRVLFVFPPTSVAVNQLENDQFITFFQEQTTLTLPDDLTVELTEPGTYNRPEQLNPQVIPAGTLVNSYLVNLDPVGDNEINLEGSIKFQNKILGIIASPSQLDETDEILGNPETAYPNSNSDRGLELDNQDRLEWNIEGRTLDLEFGDTALDQIRVITAPPSPLKVNVVAPNEVNAFGEGEVTIFYNNSGNRELVAPLLNFEVEGGFLNLPDTNEIIQETQLLGIDEEQPQFVLAPGEGGQLSIPFQAFDFPAEDIEDLETLPFPDTIQFEVNAPPRNDTINWDTNQEVVQPSFVSEAAWAQIYGNFTAAVGETVGELTNVLVENFEHFTDIGVTTANAERLINFELQQASDYGAIAARYEMGSLGRGWSFIGDAQLRTDNQGNVVLTNFSLSELQQGIQNLDFNNLASFPISGALDISRNYDFATNCQGFQLGFWTLLEMSIRHWTHPWGYQE
jgi:hypothetical protein